MTHRFILILSIAALLPACDRVATSSSQPNAADLDRQREAQVAAEQKIRDLEKRLDDQQRQSDIDKADGKIAALTAQKEEAEAKLREEQTKPAPPAPVAEAPEPTLPAPPRPPAAEPVFQGRIVDEDDVDFGPVQLVAGVPPGQNVASVHSFYEPLEDYGSWIEAGEYGYIFQPDIAVARADWRPYTDGRWIHTNYGWTWQSNEPFGWATYHYGRWANFDGIGWAWVPAREWGPSWVSWRRGRNFVGWAPLPPASRQRVNFAEDVDRTYDIGPGAYTFVPEQQFGAQTYVGVVVSPRENLTIIAATANITRVLYDVLGGGNGVYVGGPSLGSLERVAVQPVPRLNVGFIPPPLPSQSPGIPGLPTRGAGATRPQVVVQGQQIQFAPPPPLTTPAEAPRKARVASGPVHAGTGWNGVAQAEAGALRQQIDATSKTSQKHPPRAPKTQAVGPSGPEPVPAHAPKAPESVPPEVAVKPSAPAPTSEATPGDGVRMQKNPTAETPASPPKPDPVVAPPVPGARPTDKPPVDKPPLVKPSVEKQLVEKPPVEKAPVEKPPVEKPPVARPVKTPDVPADSVPVAKPAAIKPPTTPRPAVPVGTPPSVPVQPKRAVAPIPQDMPPAPTNGAATQPLPKRPVPPAASPATPVAPQRVRQPFFDANQPPPKAEKVQRPPSPGAAPQPVAGPQDPNDPKKKKKPPGGQATPEPIR